MITKQICATKDRVLLPHAQYYGMEQLSKEQQYNKKDKQKILE